MKISRMKNIRYLILTLVLSAIFLSACTGDSSRLTASNWPGLTATEDTVYVAYGPHVYALNAQNGSQRWKYPAEPDNKVAYYASPELADDGTQLILAAYDNALYSLNPETGLPSGWSFNGATNRYIGDPVATDTGIYAPNSDGHLYALDFSGSPLWDEAYSTFEPIWAGPVTDSDTVYVAALDHQIHALDLQTGAVRWTQDLETAITGTPALTDGILVAGTFGSKVFALDAESGKIRWTFETEDWVWATPAISDGTVFIGDVSGTFYAIEAASGNLIWSFAAEGGIYGGALVKDGKVYFGTEGGKFYALTTDGQSDWFYSLTGKIYGAPAFNGEYLFVATIEGDALVTALDLNGVARWPFSPEN